VQARTPIKVGATAGLRLLDGSKSEDILAAVRKHLGSYPFQIDDVSIIDGEKCRFTSCLPVTPAKQPLQVVNPACVDTCRAAGTEEGGYAWLTINYLLGKLGAAKDDTVAVVDLGGGSVQMAYAMAEAQAKKAPDGYIQTLSGGGKTYHVYMHRYLFAWPRALRHYMEWPIRGLQGPEQYVPIVLQLSGLRLDGCEGSCFGVGRHGGREPLRAC